MQQQTQKQRTMKLLLSIFLVLATLAFNPIASSAASCGGSCATLDDCDGQLVCTDGKCSNDPEIGTGSQVCTTLPLPSRSPPSSGTCTSSGTLRCGAKSFPRFQCSPPVTSSTRATLSNNNFEEGGSGGSQSQCDERFHSNSEPVVALSTGWYDGGSRCGKKIRITSEKTGKTVVAKVVDQCDSMNGCDDEHANLPPCKNDIVDGSNAVWEALGLDVDVGLEDVTWAMA